MQKTRLYTTLFTFCLWINGVMDKIDIGAKSGVNRVCIDTIGDLNSAGGIPLSTNCLFIYNSAAERYKEKNKRNRPIIVLQVIILKMPQNNSQKREPPSNTDKEPPEYCITLYFRGKKFSRKLNLKYFREKIFSRILFTRKYVPAKISSRENNFPRKYLLAKISSRENIFLRFFSVPQI